MSSGLPQVDSDSRIEENEASVVSTNLDFSLWLHPISLVLLLTGTTAFVALVLPASDFAQWETAKFLDSESGGLLALGILAICVGLFIGSRGWRGVRGIHVTLTYEDLRRVRRLYNVMLVCTIAGYAFWVLSGAVQGVSLAQLSAVLSQEPGAISDLKSSARPIAGVTTFTQFGPMVVLLGFLLRKYANGPRWHYLVVLLAIFRALFYAERLAIIEVLVPIAILASVTAGTLTGSRRAIVRFLPLYAVPLLWGFFSIFEYFRSWVFLRTQTSESFFSFTALRLLGYYITSFNNSALFDSQLQAIPGKAFPYQTFPFIWNAPLFGNLFGSPTYLGLDSADWIKSVLSIYASPNFTNKGSFLVVHGELGTVGMVLVWILLGLFIGLVYRSANSGRPAALLSYCVLAVGLLELPRIIYWTEGRSTPVLLSCVFIWLVLKHRGVRSL